MSNPQPAHREAVPAPATGQDRATGQAREPGPQRPAARACPADRSEDHLIRGYD